jgi:acyl carrier protein
MRKLLACALALTLATTLAAQTPEEVRSRVRAAIADQLRVDAKNIEPTRRLTEYGMDELDLVELIMTLEDRFDVEIPDEAVTMKKSTGWVDSVTMQRLVDIVNERLRKKSTSR